jgi:uncharacterized protein (DUF2236 family)
VIRDAVRGAIGSYFSSDRFAEEQYDEPLGDPGLFGPDSVTWRVHADVSMFVGGIAALLLQSLHPRAAAVVAGSSRFREQPLHRLSRTGSFVAATTYGSTPVAESIIDRVRAVHARIPGAAEPDLLRWVHVAEVSMFLASYRRFHPVPLSATDIDRYYEENATVAERLGATRVPRSRAEVQQYFLDIRPELRTGPDAEELHAFLRRPLSEQAGVKAIYALFVQAAGAQLPGWARAMHGISLPPGADALGIRPATWAVLEALRLTAGPSPILGAARERASGVPSRRGEPTPRPPAGR